MDRIVTVALPIFALVLSGWGAGRLRLLSPASFVGLNAFVYYFALPALLFSRMAETPLAQLFEWRFLAAYLTGGLSIFGVAMLLGRILFGHPLRVLAIQGLAAAYPNVGYMGLPLIITAFGERATLPAVLVLVTDVTVTFSLGIALVEAGRGGGGRWPSVARAVGTSIVRNPILLAVVAGALLALAEIGLQASLRAFAELLGSAALPCALFALGASLVGRPVAAAAGEVSLIVALKLLAHPLLVWALATRVFQLEPLWATVAVIQASLPVAATVFVIAQQHEIYVDRASAIVLVSTAVSVVTVSAFLAFLG